MADYYDLNQDERDWWNAYGRYRDVKNNQPGYDAAQDDRRKTARKWLEDERDKIEQAVADESGGKTAMGPDTEKAWAKNNRRARWTQLFDSSLDYATCMNVCKLPATNATDAEAAYIGERKGWWRIDTTGQDSLQKLSRANWDWLVSRRKYVWELAEGKVQGEKPGWDHANREDRYYNLQVATKYGSGYDDWKKSHNTTTGEKKDAPKSSGRDAAVKNAKSYLGTKENPLGSNKGEKQPSTWLRRVLGYDGQPWCACFTTCMAWDAGVSGAGSAGVQQCVNYAKAGSSGSIYRAWTTDPSKVRKGDHAVIGSTSTHIEMVIDDSDAKHTIGGNTSGTYNGSQANGDGVYERHRGSDVVGWCLVRFD